MRFMSVGAIGAVLLASSLAPAGSATAAKEQSAPRICAEARESLSKDAALAAAARVAFGGDKFAPEADTDCLVPYQVLKFASADVLLTTSALEDNNCHACSATLSAFFLRRDNGAARLVARHMNFVETGSNGTPGDIAPMTFGGDEGFTIENGWMGQGYAISSLSLFIFRKGKAVELTHGKAIPLGIDNSGADPNEGTRRDVEAKWKIDPAAATVTIDWTGAVDGKSVRSQAVFARKGDRVTRVSGQIPAAVREGF